LITSKDKHQRQLKKKFKTELAAKDRRCVAQISRNNASNEQVCFDIQQEAHNQLFAINEKFLTGQREIVTLKRENRLALDEERRRYKASCRELVKSHAHDIKRKNDKLKDMREEVCGMREMMYEMIDEVNDAKRSASAGAAKMSQVKLTSLMSTIRKMTSTCNDLKDEIVDESNYCTELQEKVDEYEVVIVSMQREYEEKESEYKSIIEYMDFYYEEVVQQLQPQYIMKHWVKNKTRGETSVYFLFLLDSMPI